MEKFKIIKAIQFSIPNSAAIIEEVEGERIMIMDQPSFIFKETEETEHGSVEGWNVSHLETGMRMACSLVKSNAIAKAEEGLAKNKNAVKSAKETLKYIGVSIPVNI